MNILIIGKTGQLGSILNKILENNLKHRVIALSREELDIINKSQFKQLVNEYKPDIVVNAAAFHNSYQCEIEPVKAFKINCIAVKDMAEICFNNNPSIEFITFSTDYVFDGSLNRPYIEIDKPQPLNVYGLSKLAGEYGALMYPTSFVIRTCGLYGSKYGKKSFIDNILESYNNHSQDNPIEISIDLTISPTHTKDLTKALIQLIEYNEKYNEKNAGIYHLINEGYTTWYDFAKEAFEILSLDTNKLKPIDRKGYWNNIKKPLFSALKNERAFKEYGIKLPHWKDALREYLNESQNKTTY